ncbi:MAG: SGNH/GDSL hydrolase family protein [Actinomycetota bacterium]
MEHLERYVALGDSMTEGLFDPDGSGGNRGWADRLAEYLASSRGDLLYANLAVRGRRTHEVKEQQLEPALALAPDIVSVVTGMNDLLRPSFDLDRVAGDLDQMVGACRDADATVVMMTYGDPVPVNPYARVLRKRMKALNERLRDLARRHDAVLVDFTEEAVVSDARFWCADRLHANSEGHARIAAAAAEALGIQVQGPRWNDPLPPAERRARRERIAEEIAWARQHLAPWVTRRFRRVSSGDGIEAKHPELVALKRSGPAG